jgi:hypothetical protein
MPGLVTPRQQALHRLLGPVPIAPRVSIETTSLQIYRTILTTTDRLTLMSSAEAELNDRRSLAVLPFRSAHLQRFDGVATRANWEPTKGHLQFLDLLRAEAKAQSAPRVVAGALRRMPKGH